MKHISHFIKISYLINLFLVCFFVACTSDVLVVIDPENPFLNANTPVIFKDRKGIAYEPFYLNDSTIHVIFPQDVELECLEVLLRDSEDSVYYPKWLKSIPDFIDDSYSQICKSALRNEKLYPNWHPLNEYPQTSYRELVEKMKTNFIKQLKIMDEEIGLL